MSDGRGKDLSHPRARILTTGVNDVLREVRVILLGRRMCLALHDA